MLRSGSGLLDPVLENTLSKYKRGGAALKVKQISWFWRQNGALLERADLSFELSDWILFLVAKCSNIPQDTVKFCLPLNKVFLYLVSRRLHKQVKNKNI
jgi:hypothetical protein